MALLAVWSPVAVSGVVVGCLARFPLVPEDMSAQLVESWWEALLAVIEFSGPTFIKVLLLVQLSIACILYAIVYTKRCCRFYWCT